MSSRVPAAQLNICCRVIADSWIPTGRRNGKSLMLEMTFIDAQLLRTVSME